MAKDFDISAKGLADFRRDLKRLDAEAPKALQKELKAAVAKVSIEAAATAPRKSGDLARSYRPFTRGNIAGVRSNLPYAGVQEYGGTISPKGTPFVIRPHETVTRAVEHKREALVNDIADAIEAAARRNGWH